MVGVRLSLLRTQSRSNFFPNRPLVVLENHYRVRDEVGGKKKETFRVACKSDRPQFALAS